MALTRKEVADKVKTRAHERLIEARHVMKAMNYPASMSCNEIAETATRLALEAQELGCRKQIGVFFQSVATSAETIIVSDLLSRTRKSKLYKDSSRDGATMRRALRKENELKAKMARGWKQITHTADDMAKRRAELDSYLSIIKHAKLMTKERAGNQAAPSPTAKKGCGEQDEQAVQHAL